jgi:ElaB/YqjD/DUF883 family membrane-anchored ribosome-binding protein
MSTDDLQNDLKQKATSILNDVFQGEDPQEKMKDWANDTRQLIERHPWLAVAGALAIGYIWGSMKRRSRGGDR